MIALRVLTGTALVALYTIIESWLNSQAPREQRGRIFAIYMMVNLGALALAQQLLRLDEATAFTLFAVSAVLVCLAVMPVSATAWSSRSRAAAHFSLRLLMRAAPLAVAGGLLSGLAMGAFWGMGAVYAGTDRSCRRRRGPVHERGDPRRRPAAMAAGRIFRPARPTPRAGRGGTAAALAAGLLAASSFAGYWAIGAVAIYGGLAFAIYPIAVALLVDHLAADDLLTGSSGLLLVHGGRGDR